MAQYKVIQDIEAEDKLVGPLSLRQFIYAIVVVACGFVGFQLGRINVFLAIPFVPPMLFFGLLSAPIGHSQSSEVWLLAKFRYWLFPKQRIWDQTGQQQLVTITAPKKAEEHLTKEFGKEEARSRLKALANTLDTRGWAVKNIDTETFQRSTSLGKRDEERLIDIDSLPREADDSISPSNDLLDPTTNPVAAKMETMIDSSSTTHRQELLDRVHSLAQQTADTAPTAQTAVEQPVIRPQPEEAPDPGLQQIITHSKKEPPAQPKAAKKQPQKQAQATMTTPDNTAILKGVKQEGRTSLEVKRNTNDKDPDDEVVVSLH